MPKTFEKQQYQTQHLLRGSLIKFKKAYLIGEIKDNKCIFNSSHCVLADDVAIIVSYPNLNRITVMFSDGTMGWIFKKDTLRNNVIEIIKD